MANKDFQLDNGVACSRAAYIKQEFNKGKSRGDIAKELDVAYYVVYSATVNMFNAAHPEGATGRGGFKAEVITITANSREFVPVAEAYEGSEDLVEINRADFIRELAQAGKSRGEIAKLLDVAYATVYAATKELGGATATRVTLTHPETGAEITRADYIRELFEQGKTRREIAVLITKMTDELCDYSTVWAATKPAKVEDATEAVDDIDEAEMEAGMIDNDEELDANE